MLEVPDWGLSSWSWFEYGHWSMVHPCSDFLLFILSWRCKEHPCPLSPHLGLWRMLEVPDWGLASSSWLGYSHWSLEHPWSEFWLSVIWGLGGRWRSWWRFGILILIWIWSLVFDTPMIGFLLSILIFNVQRRLMSFKSSFGDLEDAGGSWLGFGTFFMIWIWSRVFDIPMSPN